MYWLLGLFSSEILLVSVGVLSASVVGEDMATSDPIEGFRGFSRTPLLGWCQVLLSMESVFCWLLEVLDFPSLVRFELSLTLSASFNLSTLCGCHVLESLSFAGEVLASKASH
jgi:hypothetical protein